jgi:hypothetical protein
MLKMTSISGLPVTMLLGPHGLQNFGGVGVLDEALALLRR